MKQLKRKYSLFYLLLATLIITTILTSCSKKDTEVATVQAQKSTIEQSVVPETTKQAEKAKVPEATLKPTNEPAPTPTTEPSATLAPKPEVTKPAPTQAPKATSKLSPQEFVQKPTEPKPTQESKPDEQDISNNQTANYIVSMPESVQMFTGKSFSFGVANGIAESYKITYLSPDAGLSISLDASKRNFDIAKTDKTCYAEIKTSVLGDDGKKYAFETIVIVSLRYMPGQPTNSISRSSSKLIVGSEYILKYSGSPIKWTSSDESVATVDNGTITALISGKTYITAYYDTGTSTIVINVP